MLFYQDFNEQFEGYTQPSSWPVVCISVVLSGFQWTIWRIYTTSYGDDRRGIRCFIRISMNNLKDIHNMGGIDAHLQRVVLSGFQWTIWRIYTTVVLLCSARLWLFYQDFNEQFEGYTQLGLGLCICPRSCFIRISMNNLKDIHNPQKKRIRFI